MVMLPSAAARARLMVPESAAILKRFYFIERELIMRQAGWLPGIAHWETKLLLPEIMWESSVLTAALRQRILELRYPERRIVVDKDDALVALAAACGAAPNAVGFVLALAQVIKPHLLAAYRQYQSMTDSLDDGPTQHMLRHAIADLESQLSRLRTVAAAALTAFPDEADAAGEWLQAVSTRFEATKISAYFQASPQAGRGENAMRRAGKPFAISRVAQRDPRFTVTGFAWPDRHSPGNPGTGLQLQARQAVHHVNEVWAAEMAAACLHDLAPEAPQEFLEDAARWCYDEIRHCRMGYERLKAWGFSDAEIPLDAFSYNAGARVEALTRLGIIFYFEATYIHTKKERSLIFAGMGDRLSSHDMDFDWADELIHTHYGKHWLETLLKAEDDGRTVATVKEQARAAVSRLTEAATVKQKSKTAEIFASVMARMHAFFSERA